MSESDSSVGALASQWSIPEWVDVEVTLPSVAPLTLDDLTYHMVTEDQHGAWREIWPDARERWAWLRWLNRCGTEPRRLTSPPFAHGGRACVRVYSMQETAANVCDFVAQLRGVDRWWADG